MTDKTNKERTSITIDPDLFARAKGYCRRTRVNSGKKFSFSELVSQALESFLPEKAQITAIEPPVIANGQVGEMVLAKEEYEVVGTVKAEDV